MENIELQPIQIVKRVHKDDFGSYGFNVIDFTRENLKWEIGNYLWDNDLIDEKRTVIGREIEFKFTFYVGKKIK
jgi:hypothetical protein